MLECYCVFRLPPGFLQLYLELIRNSNTNDVFLVSKLVSMFVT